MRVLICLLEKQLKEELRKFSPITGHRSKSQKDMDYLTLYKIIFKYSKLKVNSVNEKNREQRLKIIGDDKAYRKLAATHIKEIEEIHKRYTKLVLKHFNMKEEDFIEVRRNNIYNETFQNQINDIESTSNDTDDFEPTISKEEAKEA
jgi:hypothetical protein